jgi:catechol 2,3-dioxygenase-like lactoylglutathione lyase family enzyme
VAAHDHVVLSVANIDETIPVFKDLLNWDVKVEDTTNSTYLSSVCVKTVSRVAVCRSKSEDYTVELWETGSSGNVENIYISASGSIHLCFLCQGIDDLYNKFKEENVRFVNEPIPVTKGANRGAKAIFFHTPGYLWIELLCRAEMI